MLNIEITHQDSAAIVVISGEVDLYSSPKVRESLLALTKKEQPAIVINLQDVGYMDSSGLATLIEGMQSSAKYGGKFLLTNLREGVLEVFQLSQLDKVFKIYDSPETALKDV